MIHSQVIQLDRSQNQAAVEILTQAFTADPMFNYFTRGESSKLRAIEHFSRSVLLYSQDYEQIYTTANELKGIALWIPPGQFPMNDIRLLKLGGYRFLVNLNLWKILEFFSLFNQAEKYHRSDVPQPHWYLLMLGVSPKHQSQGIGSALIQPVLQQADRDGLPCYLETTTEKGVRFYQKAGFEILRTIEFDRGNQIIWTMKREPLPKNC
jgi:ribosomal protein S18 acetylase RimI-like enzyme